MADRRKDQHQNIGPDPQGSARRGGGYPAPGYGRGYGRDFGGGGLGQGFDGSWGQGYGGSLEPNDLRAGVGGPGFGSGEGAQDGGRSFAPHGEGFTGERPDWGAGRTDANDPLPGPHRGRGPRGWTRSDARIYEAVCDRLADDPLLDARNIEVAVDSGAVTLAGDVRRPSDVRLAEMIARETGGVTEVRNALRYAG